MPQRVFVDANVFYSRTIMDWLFHLRLTNAGMFQLHSTNDVMVEVLYHRRKNHPKESAKFTTDRIDKIKAVLDEVIEDYPAKDPSFSGTDDGDYHVHAAARHACADFILSDDNPEHITTRPDEEPYEIITPDEFFVLVADSAPDRLLQAVAGQLDYYSTRPACRQLDEALLRAGCPVFADVVRQALRTIALKSAARPAYRLMND